MNQSVNMCNAALLDQQFRPAISYIVDAVAPLMRAHESAQFADFPLMTGPAHINGRTRATLSDSLNESAECLRGILLSSLMPPQCGIPSYVHGVTAWSTAN
jgi:hypothetical protein